MKELFIGLFLMASSLGGLIAIMFVSEWYDVYRIKKEFKKRKKVNDELMSVFFYENMIEVAQQAVNENIRVTKENLEWLKNWKDKADGIKTEEAKDYEWLN